MNSKKSVSLPHNKILKKQFDEIVEIDFSNSRNGCFR